MATPIRNAVKFGPLARFIRLKMHMKGIKSPWELADLFPEPTKAYHNIQIWLSAKGAPGPRYRDKLAEILDIDPEALIANEPKLVVTEPKALITVPVPTTSVPLKPKVVAPLTSKSKEKETTETTISITLSKDGTISINIAAKPQ
jgi:hypothetical protein